MAERVAQQNELFEEFYQAGLKNSPERATAVGDYRYNAQLSDVSLAQIERQHAENNAFLARPRFDIKAFHDEILSGGPLPLDLLEERVDGWIKTQLQPQAATAQ